MSEAFSAKMVYIKQAQPEVCQNDNSGYSRNEIGLAGLSHHADEI